MHPYFYFSYKYSRGKFLFDKFVLSNEELEKCRLAIDSSMSYELWRTFGLKARARVDSGLAPSSLFAKVQLVQYHHTEAERQKFL